jgi:ribose-phosphate pyrophosphokinase
MSQGEMVVFTGNANPGLAQKICAYLGKSLGKAKVARFSDGEIQVEIEENIRRKEVFIIQPTCHPVNENLMELLVMIDAFKRSSASRIIAVIPYYGYARQDRKVAPRAPISAKLVANLITEAGAHKVIAIDLHAGQIQGFFDIPVDNLYAKRDILAYIQKNFSGRLVMVSPDAGGVERTRSFAKILSADLAIIDKRRSAPGKAKAMAVIGDVRKKTAIILDDMVDTAGTLTEAAAVLLEKGAKEVNAICVHPVLSGSAVERIKKSPLKRVVVTDTIPLGEEAAKSDKIEVISVANLIAEAMHRSYTGDSVHSLFV